MAMCLTTVTVLYNVNPGILSFCIAVAACYVACNGCSFARTLDALGCGRSSTESMTHFSFKDVTYRRAGGDALYGSK